MSRNFSFTNSDQLTYLRWLGHIWPKSKKMVYSRSYEVYWHKFLWVTLSHLNATFSSQQGYCQPFWLKTNKLLKFGEIAQFLGSQKQHFPNIWLNCVFFNRNISKRKFTSTRSNLQSGSDTTYHPQRVKGLSVSRNCLRQNQVKFC